MAYSKEKLSLIHSDALKLFGDIIGVQKDEREQCLLDRRFYSIAGAQWEGKLGDQFKNKPKFEVNKIHLSVIRIINEYRNNRITVDFMSKDGSANDDLANTADGLYRADEQRSSANEAYDNAFEEAVGGGIGAWRLRAEYEDEDDDENEYQRISIEPIYDADSTVFFDLNAKRQDKRDAKHCFVLTPMTVSEYKDTWDDDPSSWPNEINKQEFDWASGNDVYIAEYYCVEMKRESIYFYRTVTGEEERYTSADFTNDEDLADNLDQVGTKLDREKRVKRKRVHKYILSGGGILEDAGYIAGKNIPIIITYGKRWVVDNIERCMGHVRLAKDPQRLKNMQLSKLGEISALSPVEKPILTPSQVAGHSVMWTEDNVKNFPFLLLNPITGLDGNPLPAGPMGYTKPPSIPPAMAALLQITESDMQDILGNQGQGEEIRSGVSGEAISLIQGQLDMQTFIYMSNFAKAMKRSGEVWLGMAKEIMVESGRKMKVVDNREASSSVILGQEAVDEETNETILLNDLTKAGFDVAVSVGPSSRSRKQATVRMVTSMMQVATDPETLTVLGSMAIMNMEGEGIDDVKEYFRKRLINMGVIEPTEEEAQELAEVKANTPPDANTEYLQSAAAAESARAIESQMNTVLKGAKAKGTEAKTLETLAGIDRDDQTAAVDMAAEIQSMIDEETAQPL
tara:strand:- start:9735 stop:11783 length:2049 start_codon:yes stop_codon:yes gene_type:complete